MTTSLASSQAYCRRVARRAKSSFPLTFRVLPRPKRDAMTALYAFLRVTDDLADDPGDPAAKRAALAAWRGRLDAALQDATPSHRVHAALAHAVHTYDIPPAHLHAVLDGVESDLDPVAVATFADLYPYCYRVAAAVGLACVPVWGLRPGLDPDRATAPAEAAGIAFQLTNILRDVGEDAARGRVYLPADDLAAFGLTPATWDRQESRSAFRALVRFEAGRARAYYARSEPLAGLLTRDGRAVFGVMTGVYRRLLDEVERAGCDVFERRVRVGRLTKARVLAGAWPVRWGWV